MKNDYAFVTPQYLRVWANWCEVHGERRELQEALMNAAVEIERLQFRLGERAVNGNGHNIAALSTTRVSP